MTQTTIDARTAQQTADEINAAFAAGTITTANGRELTSSWNRPPATAWQNGSVSVTVKGRSKRTTALVWAKVGQTLTTA